jgi:hypothetical protein
MALYIRIDEREDLDWLKRLISNSLALEPNHPMLLTNYKYLYNWDQYLNHPVSAKEVSNNTTDPKEILTETDREKTAPKPARRGRPPSAKTKQRAKKKPKEDVDPFQCPAHKTYGAKRRPRSECTKCWELFKQFHPLEYPQARIDFERANKRAVNG